MPPGGFQTRAHQMGTIAAEIHRRYTSEELGALLDSAEEEAEEEAEAEAEERSALAVRAVRRIYDQRIRVPSEFVVRRTEVSARAREAWKSARRNNDFGEFAPLLSRQFALAREYAGYLGYDRNPYDALLDSFEPGVTYDWISSRFSAVQQPLQRLISRIAEARSRNSRFAKSGRAAHRRVDAETQLQFSRKLAACVGYDFNHGRLDLSTHPFTSGGSYQDVRLTTRVVPDHFPSCLFATIHEAGHGIHGQKLHPQLYRLPFRYGLALAESQSRFYENLIARSHEFWQFHFPQLKLEVPALADLTLDEWYTAINSVQPTLIRVEADEVTYGMHIMLRFELENALIGGELSVSDLPSEWNRRMKEYLGVVPETDSSGVLQDIHWSQSGIGYFPDYLLGSMLSSQLWDALEQAHPEVRSQLAAGELGDISDWLRSNVQQHGGLYTFAQITENATGRPFGSASYMSYLTQKYERIYAL